MALLPQVVTRNWRLKLAAFGLTVVLWVVVRTDAGPSTAETLRSVPVRVQVNDPNWTLAADPRPQVVEVRLSGTFPELLGVTGDAVSVRVPVDEVTGRDSVVELRRDWVVLDGGRGLVVQEIVPSSVTLSFARTESRTVPVAVRTTGELPGDMGLAAPIGLNPEAVRVRGAAGRVLGLDSVPLLPLDLSSARESGIYEVEVDTGELAGLTVAPTTVGLGIRLEPLTERVVAGIPVRIEGLPGPGADSGWVVTPATIQVTLRGARTPVTATALDVLQAVLATEALQGMVPGDERRVQVRIRGVPALVRAFAAVDSVTVERVAVEPPPGPPDTAATDTTGSGGTALPSDTVGSEPGRSDGRARPVPPGEPGRGGG